MTRNLIGIELSGRKHPWSLAKSMAWIRDCGYDFCEMLISDFPLIIEGVVNQRYVDFLRPIMENSGLGFTFHIGTGLDLRDTTNLALHRKVLMSSIDICSQLGVPVLTVHFEQASPRQIIEKNFTESYRRAADYAQEKGVSLCMENIEVEDYRLVPELLDRINSPSLGMTLDFGHLYLSTLYFCGDYFSAIDEVAPYVSHVHIHDNTGTFEPMRLTDFEKYKQKSIIERIAFGRGDIHLPVFWGTLPVAESINRLLAHSYKGRILLECGGDMYEPFYGDMLKEMKDALKW